MKVASLKALLDAKNIAYSSTANKSELETLATANGISITDSPSESASTSSSDDDDNSSPYVNEVENQRRPAPAPVVDGTDFPINNVEIGNVRHKYHRLYTKPEARKRHETEEGANDGGFDAFLYKKGSKEIPFITDDRKFVKDFVDGKIDSFNLTAVVSGRVLKATEWDEERPEVFWELNTIVSKVDKDYQRMDTFKSALFNPANFKANPTALRDSGILSTVMESSM